MLTPLLGDPLNNISVHRRRDLVEAQIEAVQEHIANALHEVCHALVLAGASVWDQIFPVGSSLSLSPASCSRLKTILQVQGNK
jgi:hypothetical protein